MRFEIDRISSPGVRSHVTEAVKAIQSHAGAGRGSSAEPLVAVSDLRHFVQGSKGHRRTKPWLYVALLNSGADGRALSEPAVQLQLANGHIVLFEPKSHGKQWVAHLTEFLRGVAARFAPDRIQEAAYAQADDVLWLTFGDGLQRALRWSALPFAKGGLKPQTVRVSEHGDALIFEGPKGEEDVDAVALRGLASPESADGLEAERRMAASSLGERLRAARVRRDLTQEALAAKSGLPQATISRLEAGDREPRWGTLEKYAAGLGLTVPALLGEAREPKQPHES